MITTRKLAIVLLAALALAACEGYTCATGIVSDAETGEPLADVRCRVVDGSDDVVTDSEGRYDVCGPFGGCVGNCPDVRVEFSKAGYATVTLTNPADVALERE